MGQQRPGMRTEMTTQFQRHQLKQLMSQLVAYQKSIHYPENDIRGKADTETFQLEAPHPPMTMDCSEAVTLLCKWAGLKDPNGLNYTHPGYTGTLLAHLPRYNNPANANVGALVVFGPGTGEHVCMVYQPGDDPLLFSHGSEAGPVFIRLAVERTYHRPPVTFLSIADL